MAPTRRSFLAATPLLLSGCVSIGSATLARDQRQYSEAIATAAKRQILSTVVRLRYADHVAFLDVGQIVTGYQLEASLGTGSVLMDGLTLGSDTDVNVNGTYTDRPTVTWQPIVGAALSERLLQPLPPGVLAMLSLTGFSPELVFGLGATSVNGIANGTTRPGETVVADPRWDTLMDRFRVLRTAGILGLRSDRDGLGRARFVMSDESRGFDPRVVDLARLLRLRPDLYEWPLIYGTGVGEGREIRILSRPLFDVLLEVAGRIEVPSDDVLSGKTPLPATNVPSRPRFRVHSGSLAPDDAFVGVTYGGSAFWIDQRDYASKQSFTFLMMLVSLAQNDPGGQQPILTIPAG
jgi:hypothetical protein